MARELTLEELKGKVELLTGISTRLRSTAEVDLVSLTNIDKADALLKFLRESVVSKLESGNLSDKDNLLINEQAYETVREVDVLLIHAHRSLS